MDWWWVGEFKTPESRIQVYVEHSTMKAVGKNAYQFVTRFIADRQASTGEVSSLAEYMIECDRKRATLIARTPVDAAGKIMASHRFDGLPPEPIHRDTSMDAIRRHVCRDRPLPSMAVASPMEHAMTSWGRTVAKSEPEPKPAEEQASAGYGTGFFVNDYGDIVTSYHVIDGADSITVYTSDGKSHEARLMRGSPATDLAVLRIDYKPRDFLTLAPANSTRPGDKVFTFGFPVMELLGAEPKFTDGAISSLSGIGGEAAFAQISVPVQPGNSGGPVVNEAGFVVGVVAAGAAVEEFVKVSEGALPQNVNWAVRSEYISPLIGSQSPPLNLSRADAITHARQSVVIVFVEKEAASN